MVSNVAARTRLPTGHLRAMPALILAKNRCLTVQPTRISSTVLNGPPALPLTATRRGATANGQKHQL